MQAVIFDLDHTIFDANQALYEGAADLLAILSSLGLKIDAVSNKDHRALVHLDEAGIRRFSDHVMCSAHAAEPKSTESLARLLEKLGVESHQTALVTHAHSDILVGKDARLAKTIGVSHGLENAVVLHRAGADHIVSDIPSVLDVLN
jgi:phosphoglycolate phosphatase-like HAD superfamily hydrolase